MKSLIVATLIAATTLAAIPTTASAIVVGVGPRGGVHVGVGVRRPFVRRPFVARPFAGRRFYGGRWHAWRRW
jgi:hypothetical protein